MAAKRRSSWRLLGALLWLVSLPAYGSISAPISATPAPDLIPADLLEELSAPALEEQTVFRSTLYKSTSQAKTRVSGSDFDKASHLYGNRRFKVEFTVRASLYLFDALGSPVNLVSPDGTVQQRTQYDAWGNVRQETGDSWNPFGFTGHELDDETGLYYARARFYDPEVGRFLSEDPFGGFHDRPPSLHRYLYASVNPTVFYDPTGKIDALVGLSAMAGAYQEYLLELSESLDQNAEGLEDANLLGLAAGLFGAAEEMLTVVNLGVDALAVEVAPDSEWADQARGDFEAIVDSLAEAAMRGIEVVQEDPAGFVNKALTRPPMMILEKGVEAVGAIASDNPAVRAKLVSDVVELAAEVGVGEGSRRLLGTVGAIDDVVDSLDELPLRVPPSTGKRSSPVVEVEFRSYGEAEEFARQLGGQEHGINQLTAGEIRRNIERFRSEGRPSSAASAARRFRRENPEAAKGQAALHNPDPCIGGPANCVNDFGDLRVNSSLGSQNRYRQDQIYEAVSGVPDDQKVTFSFLIEGDP